MLPFLRPTALLLALALPATAQQQSGEPAVGAVKSRPTLSQADYARMETLGNTALSPDGRWIAYDFRRGSGGGNGELRYRIVGAPDTSEKSVRVASGPTFSANSRWLLYTIGVDSAALPGRGRGAGGGTSGAGRGASGGSTISAARNKVGLVDLRTGVASVLADVQSFAISKRGTHVALRRYPAAGRTGRGADLVVRSLEQGTDVTFGNVVDFAWNDDGDLLAMTTDVDGKTGNGVQVLNVATGVLRALDSGDAIYTNVVWRAKSSDLAVMRSRVDSAFVDTSYVVLAWRGLSGGGPSASRQLYDFSTDAAFPAGMRVASYRAPVWAKDGSVLFFGIAPREPKPTPGARSDARPARVEVWHWGDVRQYHQQDRQASQDRQKTHLVALRLNATSIVRLADDSMETVQLSESRLVAITTDDAPYYREYLTGRPYRDVYRVDLTTGKREKVVTKAPFGATISPTGRYLLYTQGGHWWTYDLSSGKRTNVTASTKSTFVDMEDDHPVAERRGYGVGGWIAGDASVLLYDRFDVWQVAPDGSSATRLTRGAEDSTAYRVVSLEDDARPGPGAGFGPAAPTTIDPKKPIMLSATGEFNKKSGYATLTLGKSAAAQRVLWLEQGVSRLEKAKNADVYSYVVQSASESPNVFTATGALADAKQVSRTNAFLADFAWGKQVLMDYTTPSGETLQMMLTYPADYQPGRQYPMVVYYYEKLSQGFHQFVVPSERATYNTSVFSQNGYFVLRPDIRFKARNPGVSGLECVTAAVQAALATGMIDPKRVGNMGHSWGGYQSAFYAVHGNGMFAATIAGAPLTNLVSFYGYTSFNSGFPETGHFETGQERMEVSLWEDPQAYIRNSTVFAMDKLQTPLLLEEGDVDGNVDYRQSMELYNAGKRLGKQVAFLLYNDENHGVARPESQMDYHRRQLEWFAHYLKGEPAAEWIAKGETYLARQKLLKEAVTPGESLPVQAGGARP